MAIFSNKIEQVKFVDREEKTIEILYLQDSETLSTYYLEINYNDQNFLDLLEEISIEEIQDNTRDHYQSIENNKNLVIHQAAKAMFDEWVKNAQADLDKQDEERYKIFERYKEEQLQTFDVQIEERYKEADRYTEEQLKILQTELDIQIEERYKEVDVYKEEQLQILQKELDLQIEERYKEVDAYKTEELKNVDAYKTEELKNVDAYRDKQLGILQAELDLQVQNRYKEVDEYRSEQLQILQKELDDQVQGRYKEVDKYKEEQIKLLEAEQKEQKKEVEETKSLLLEKFQAVTAPAIAITPEKAIKNIIDNFEDEDTVFKTKLEIFNLPEVKNCKDREMKMKVRKAKTVPEVFAAYHDIQYSNS